MCMCKFDPCYPVNFRMDGKYSGVLYSVYVKSFNIRTEGVASRTRSVLPVRQFLVAFMSISL